MHRSITLGVGKIGWPSLWTRNLGFANSTEIVLAILTRITNMGVNYTGMSVRSACRRESN